MKLVAISDVHGKWNKITIPDCDLLEKYKEEVVKNRAALQERDGPG